MKTLPTSPILTSADKAAVDKLKLKLASIEDTTSIIVSDQKSCNEAGLSISQYKSLEKDIEKTRKNITDPINVLVKLINQYFKNLLISSVIPSELERLNKSVLSYNSAEKIKQEDLIRAERIKLEEEALNKAIESGKDEPAIIVETIIPDYKLSNANAFVTTVKNKKWRVIDLSLVPDFLFLLDESRINADRRSSRSDDVSPYPGIEYYTEDSIRTK